MGEQNCRELSVGCDFGVSLTGAQANRRLDGVSEAASRAGDGNEKLNPREAASIPGGQVACLSQSFLWGA